jgi:hypothetical protein
MSATTKTPDHHGEPSPTATPQQNSGTNETQAPAALQHVVPPRRNET